MDTKEKDEEVIGLKHIIIYYLKHWKLFLYAGLFTLIPAILYLIYEVFRVESLQWTGH